MQRHLGGGPGIFADWIPDPKTSAGWDLCQMLFDPITLPTALAPEYANNLIRTEPHLRRAVAARLRALGCSVAPGLGAPLGGGLLG